MSASPFSLFKSIFLTIKNKQKHLAIAVIVALLLTQFSALEHINPVHAADSMSLDFHAFDENYPTVQDSGNAAPGVRIRHNDIFGYFAEVKNLSDTNPLTTPKLQMGFPALSSIVITSGLGATYSDLICKYVVQTTGFQFNWQVDYNGSGSDCTWSGIAGSNATVSGPASIPVGQSVYFRITGLKTKASYASDPFLLTAKNYATGIFGKAGTSSGAPVNTFVTVGDTTINGKTFFDNGSLSGEPDNGTKEADESYVSAPALFTMWITDGDRTYSGPVDGSGNYSIVVPENNEIGALIYYMGAPSMPAGFRVTSTLPSGILAVSGTTITNSDIGFNNQTDLSLNIISDAADPIIGSTINYTITLNNNGPTTATNILVDLPIATQSSYSTSTPGVGTHTSYEAGTTTLHWTIDTLAASTSATLIVTVTISGIGLLTQHAEVISQDTPVSTYGSPDEDSTPGNHIGSEDDYAFTSFSITNQPQISGFTFVDTRGNHSYSGSEDPSLAGVLVTLHDVTASSDIGSTTTDASGNFSFTGLTIGHTYQTIATTPGGYNLTTSNDTQTFTNVLGNGIYTTESMGYFQPGSISGMVFIDLNSNSSRDLAENIGPSGVTVDLINGSGSTISSTTTDGTGNYSFSGLAGDNYSVHFVPPTNYGFVVEHTGTGSTDSDVNPLTGSTETIAVLSGSGVTNIDAGIYVLGADLSITKSASQTNPFVGENITYYINVHNDGPLASSGSTVSDILPSEVTYVSHTASGGTYDPISGNWTLPTIPSGENVQLNITVTVMAPTTFRNTTNIATEVQLDNNLSNNTSFVDVTATKSDTPTPSPNPSTSPSPSNSPSPTPSTSPSPSNSPSSTPSTSPSPSPIATPTLTIEKYVLVSGSNPAGISTANQNGPEVSVGSPILYYLDINNTSDVTANNIEINDSFPTTLNSAGWTCNGELNSASGGDTDLTFSRTCTVSNNGMIPDVPTSIPPHSTLHIRLSGKTVPQISGELCNSAGVKADYVNKISDAACITVVAPHITLIKSASPTQIIPGGTTTYSLTVTNTGNIAAHNVEIIDDLSNSELGSDLIPRCVLSSRQITVLDGGTMSTDTTNMAHWTIGTLAPGHSETVHLQAEIRNDLDSSVHCLNVAIAAGTSISSSQANATVSVPVTTPSGAQLTFLKEALNAVNNHVFNPGDHVQYRLSINNTGNQNSELLSIDDAGNAPILKVNSAQSTGGIVSSINPLHVGSLLVSGSRNQIVNYDSSIIDADHFPLRTYHVHKTASKTDADFYPERVQKAKLRSNDSSNSTDALGNPDGRGVSLGTRGSIVLATTKTNKMIVDGDGDDFCIATLNVQSNTRYRVSVSQSADDDTFEELATSNGKNNCFDLSDSDLSWARYIKIEDRSLATSFNEDTSINIDAVCLLHLGGLVDNTATLSTASQQIGSSTSTIVVDFTDAFDTPLSSQDCKTPKQARIIEPAPLPPLPIPVPTPVYTPSVETPVELPKTGSAPWMPLLLIGSLTAIRLYFLGRKQLKK